MSRRSNRLSAELAAFAQQYQRKAQRGVEPNDRRYSRKTEEVMKRMRPEELSALLNADADETVSRAKAKKRPPDDGFSKKIGRGP